MWTFEELTALRDRGLPQWGHGGYVTGTPGKDYCWSKINYSGGVYEPTQEELDRFYATYHSTNNT